jgi:hypothetical protein
MPIMFLLSLFSFLHVWLGSDSYANAEIEEKMSRSRPVFSCPFRKLMINQEFDQ